MVEIDDFARFSVDPECNASDRRSEPMAVSPHRRPGSEAEVTKGVRSGAYLNMRACRIQTGRRCVHAVGPEPAAQAVALADNPRQGGRNAIPGRRTIVTGIGAMPVRVDTTRTGAWGAEAFRTLGDAA